MKPLIKKLLRENLYMDKDFVYEGYDCKIPYIKRRNAYGCYIYKNGEYLNGIKGWLPLDEAKTTAINIVESLLRDGVENYDEFPIVQSSVDGMQVRKDVPNTDSIDASLSDYTILKGIREIFFNQFTQLPPLSFHSKSEMERTYRLASQIQESGEINPLIVVIDAEGPYVLEGGHRFDALRILKKNSFPALVVIEH